MKEFLKEGLKETVVLLIYEKPDCKCLEPLAVTKQTAKNIIDNYSRSGGFRLFDIAKRKMVTFMPFTVVIAETKLMIRSDENELSLLDIKNNECLSVKFNMRW